MGQNGEEEDTFEDALREVLWSEDEIRDIVREEVERREEECVHKAAKRRGGEDDD